MTEPFYFADKLNHYVNRSAYTPGQLANLADLPRTTIVNWLNGRVQRPRDWQPIVRLLMALHLDEEEADEVLRAANQPAIAELRLLASDEDRDLLKAWQRPLASPSPAIPTYTPPFQAIADIPYFVGRQAILSQLENQLRQTGGTSIFTLQGMAGTGKTALAARIAYQLRSYFADGVLWARLDTSDTMTVLHTFAQAYGADVSQYADMDSRSRVVRGLLADKRALIVLDNALDSASVTPLLPPTGRCAVLITTRRHDLRVAHGSTQFILPPFAPDGTDSQQLFAHFLSEKRVADEKDLLADVADHVGHLPLALAIIAGRLAYEPGWTTANFLARLEATSRRLKELQSENQSIRLSFDASYELLPDDVRPFFATLSLFGGEDFSSAATAVAADVPLEDAQDYLRALYGLSLVQLGRGGRYRLHPLLRDYARERLTDSLAGRRLADYFAAFLNRHDPSDAAVALERDNILAVLEEIQTNGATAVFVDLVVAFTPFLKMQGLYDVAQLRLQQALDMATNAQRLAVLIPLAQVARYYRQYDVADAYLTTAVAHAEAQQDADYLSAIQLEKGIIAGCRGDYGQSRTHFQTGLALSKQQHQSIYRIPLLKELGAAEVVHGNYDQAETYYREALTLAQQTAPSHVPMLLRCLGGIAISRDGNFAHAGTLYTEGLHQARQMNGREDTIMLLNNLAVIAFQNGAVDQAQALLMEGVSLAQSQLHQVGISMLSGNLGRLLAHEQQWEAAEQYLQTGLAVATAVAHYELIITLHYSSGLLNGSQHKYELAESHFRAALKYAQKIDRRVWVLRILAGWGWVHGQQIATNNAPRTFPDTYATLAATYHFTPTLEQFVADNLSKPTERLMIFYD